MGDTMWTSTIVNETQTTTIKAIRKRSTKRTCERYPLWLRLNIFELQRTQAINGTERRQFWLIRQLEQPADSFPYVAKKK